MVAFGRALGPTANVVSLLAVTVLFSVHETKGSTSNVEESLAPNDAAVLHSLADEWMPEGWHDGDPCQWPGVKCEVPTGGTERRVVSLTVRGVCVHRGLADRACDLPANVIKCPPS